MEKTTNATLESEYVDLLKDMRESLSEGKEFVVREVPQVAQEYVAYRRVTDTTIFSISFVLLCVCIFLTITFIRNLIILERKGEIHSEEGETTAALVLISFIFLAMLLIPSFCYGDRFVKSWAAPRVVVLEKVNELIKGE